LNTLRIENTLLDLIKDTKFVAALAPSSDKERMAELLVMYAKRAERILDLIHNRV